MSGRWRQSQIALFAGVTPITIRRWRQDGKIPFSEDDHGVAYWTPEQAAEVLEYALSRTEEGRKESRRIKKHV